MSKEATKKWRLKQTAKGLCIDCKMPRAITLRGDLGVFCERHRLLYQKTHKATRWRVKGEPSGMFDLDSFLSINPVDLSYAAALFDGEGYFGITSRPERNGLLTAVICVGMTDVEPIDFCCRIFGGKKRYHKVYQANHKPAISWRCSGRKAGAVAKAVLPYLKIQKKIDTATNIVRLAEVMGANFWRIFQDKELLKRRTSIHEEIRASL